MLPELPSQSWRLRCFRFILAGGRQQAVHGEVAMDVTLKDSGSLQEVKVIEGDPLLADAATARPWSNGRMPIRARCTASW